MNASQQAHQAYSNKHSPTRSVKSIEYEVIARITSRMKTAAMQGRKGFPALAQALHDNKKLWMAFVTDVAIPSNPLPDDLKARIVYLAEFTHLHSSQVLARKADIGPLLDVNMAIMRGLRNGVS